LTLVAADICGVDEVYKVGGAQAIAALAYGTETIKPVRKIVGPGNRYVTTAKSLVSAHVAIDMPAGPSEILILADETADPRLIALDMISQAEHGTDSIAGVLTTSEKVARDVVHELRKTVPFLERREIIAEALSNQGFIVTCRSADEMIRLANVFSPEHVEILMRKSRRIAGRISTAGLILVGSYSPVSASDYCFGTNHILPTGGFGRTYSSLSVLDFVRRGEVAECSKDGLAKLRSRVKALALAENLPNHFTAVKGRFEHE
jgi:histidinol dehydrogenase